MRKQLYFLLSVSTTAVDGGSLAELNQYVTLSNVASSLVDKQMDFIQEMLNPQAPIPLSSSNLPPSTSSAGSAFIHTIFFRWLLSYLLGVAISDCWLLNYHGTKEWVVHLWQWLLMALEWSLLQLYWSCDLFYAIFRLTVFL